MRRDELEGLLTEVRAGTKSLDEALGALERVDVADLGFAQLDIHRELRQGLPEAVYTEGKTLQQVIAIARRLLDDTTSPVIMTRVPPEMAVELLEVLPDAEHHDSARLVVLRRATTVARLGTVAVVCAGTSDLPVADEAAVTANVLGADVQRVNDVGVAGVHRVLAAQDVLRAADVVIVVAGMEGALATIVGGITPAPVIAVPTSVGYGASFEGLAALLAMLNSCAAGVAVTNIDNGFGAACCAIRILQARR